LPYFRDCLTIKGKGKYSIKLTDKEYENVRQIYWDNIYKYNSLIDNHNQLIKKYNKLVEENNHKIVYYRNLLKDIAKRGCLKIDSNGVDLIYSY